MKTKQSHMPGPWKSTTFPESNKFHKDNLMIEATTEYNAKFIADIPGARHFKEAEANARLIAAAPELLDKMKRLVAFCLFNHLNPENWQIVQAKEAIAKAEGK